MNDTERDLQEMQRDLEQLEKAATEALLASKNRPLTDDEIMAVAYSAGIANNVYRGLHEAQ